jgi:O-antigen ligase
VGLSVAAAAALGAIAIGIFYNFNPPTHEFLATRLSTANVSGRTALISAAFAKIANRPLLGYGGGVVPDHDALLAETAHDTYIQQVISFGLPLGLVASLALCATAGVFLVRRWSNAFAGVIAYTVIVQLVIFMFESSFEGTVLRVIFYLSIGLAAGLLRAMESESPRAAGASP